MNNACAENLPTDPASRSLVDPGAAPTRTISLAQMRVGQTGVIHESRLDAGDRELLNAMGLACNATVKLCRAGEPCIVAVMSGGLAGGRLGADCCRIGLARPLAEKIIVCLR
ncbi:MAG: ferrous iron transport protein A [Phycisphaerales bacterium]